ncbi:G-patch domain and KOW motifs-containing protein [Bufo gargarizans]|uniref:G-patch domain and KOW motifs-containing protein n=1 Tax=Bufo gargarizans TaxID=30331 RepID=UPI001CF3ACF9|nr:G-patch domain and KOW motifs-containing protein [Bufo gargarizans]
MAAPGSSQAPVSFGFSRVSKPKLVVPSSKDTGDGEEKEYLLAAEGKELLSTKPVAETKPLVIPLIQKNRWSQLSKEKAENGVPQTQLDPMLSQAVKELIEESRKKEQEDSEDDQTVSIPLLMQNRVPDGYEDGDKVNVSLRPEPAEAADYEVVPVEHYGMAMLRGMGWKEGEGIGKTFKQDVKPLEQKLRPKGLGLGADRSAISDLEPQRPSRPPKPGDKPEEEAKGLGTGSAVLIQSGAHKELYGKVEGLDADNCRALVKLAIGGKVVTVSQFALRLVSGAEYSKYAKDLSRLSKAEQQKERHEDEEEQRRERSPDREQRRRDDEETREQKRNGHSSSRDKRHRPRSPDREKEEKKKQKQEEQSWLRRDLKVRFIDKRYKGGKYYNSKMIVEDVSSPTICVCRTESGRILEDITQDMLETVIPKEEGDHVMVVLGKHRGQVGKILHRERHKSRALVQLEESDDAVTLSYDVICHYIGMRED